VKILNFSEDNIKMSEDLHIRSFSIELVSELFTDDERIDEQSVREYLEAIFDKAGLTIRAINIHEKR